MKKGYHKTKSGKVAKKGLYFYANKRRKAGKKPIKKGKSGELYWISSGNKTWFKKFAGALQKVTKCRWRKGEDRLFSEKTFRRQNDIISDGNKIYSSKENIFI